MGNQLLTPKELCERWKLADNTLRKWRVAGYGPAYIKLGDRRTSEVRYKIEDVVAFEEANRFVMEEK